jgi:excisionase family DNA binding protein
MANLDVIGVDETPLLIENRIVCEWLSTNNAASYLGISPNALRILVCRGKVRSYKLGSRLKFRLGDLRNLLSLKGDVR